MNTFRFETFSSKKTKRPKKKGKFAIEISEEGRQKYFIKKLKYYLKENYSFLKEECAIYREKSLKAAKPGDYIVFGTGKKYDYTVMCSETFLEDPTVGDSIECFDLEAAFKLIKSAVKRYVQKNYPSKAPAKRSAKRQYCPYASCEETVMVTAPRRVVTPPCRPIKVYTTKRSKRDWDAQVNNTYVLLTDGSRYETVAIKKSAGRESVNIDGSRYTIRRDYMGRGILV